MSKETPIICDYLPQTKKSFLISRQSVGDELLSVSKEPIAKIHSRLWKKMKKEIKKAVSDPHNLDMDEGQLNSEISLAVSNDSDPKPFWYFDFNTREIEPCLIVYCNTEANRQETVMPDEVTVGMQNRLLFSSDAEVEKIFNKDGIMPNDVDLGEQKKITKEEKEAIREIRKMVREERENIREDVSIYAFKIYKN